MRFCYAHLQELYETFLDIKNIKCIQTSFIYFNMEFVSQI